MNSNLKRAVMTGMVSAAMLGGGVIGATAFRATSVFAATNAGVTTNVRADASHAPGTPGVFVSNEDPAHEAAETAEQEAQENAGIRRTGPKAPTAPAAPSATTTP